MSLGAGALGHGLIKIAVVRWITGGIEPAMRSLISEFSYGFALTHELVLSLGSLNAAPVFPSLIEEGKAGGGYDVMLDAPGLPLFLQFKRSERLTRGTAREIKAGAALSVPYYRIALTARHDSDQHDMLIELDQAPNVVFYAAPMFHLKEEFDEAFLDGEVRARSFFVSPSAIGAFIDDGAHHLSFDGTNCVVMSDPRIVASFGASELEEMLRAKLLSDERPLRATVDAAIVTAEGARERARQLARSRHESDYFSATFVEAGAPLTGIDAFARRQLAALPPVSSPPAKDPEIEQLRRLADLGLREFNAQLYIVQRAEDSKTQ